MFDKSGTDNPFSSDTHPSINMPIKKLFYDAKPPGSSTKKVNLYFVIYKANSDIKEKAGKAEK
jgi:hypothetical protein